MNTNIYLELAGRATGKTYRLVSAINDWLNSSRTNAAIVYAINERNKLRILNDKRIVDKNCVNKNMVKIKIW